MPGRLISNLVGAVGGIVGGVLGFYTFKWLEDQGFYGLAIPGSFVGLGCGLLAQHRSIPRGVVCAVAAFALSVFTEWRFHPFLEDNSLSFLLTHLGSKNSVTLLMIGIGTAVAFFVGKDAGYRWLPERRQPAPVDRGPRAEQSG
jgi:hypothetical protein